MADAANFVLGVDLDGVVADFYEGLRPIAAEWQGVTADQLTPQVSYGLPEWGFTTPKQYEDLHRFAVVQKRLFLSLRPIPDAPAALRRLNRLGIRIRLITHRLFIKHLHEESIQQTVTWLDHYGIPYWDLCFMANKGAVGANVYIEDTPRNITELRALGPTTIVFTNSTNSKVAPPRADTWADVERLVGEQLAAWVGAGGKPVGGP